MITLRQYAEIVLTVAKMFFVGCIAVTIAAYTFADVSYEDWRLRQ